MGGTASAESLALFYSDARTYEPSDAIAAALNTYVRAQGADRIGIRCLRALHHPDGSLILNERGEQKRAVLAGVFDLSHIHDVAQQIAELNARTADDERDGLGIAGATGGWDCYFHAQRVSAPVTNALLAGRAGVVTSAGIDAYTTLPADLDPEPHAGVDDAILIAGELAQALYEIDSRIDPDALLIQQTGRGAHLLFNLEPQPLQARATVRDALRTLGRLVASTGVAVQIDQAVHDPGRLLRVAGSVNHKPTADPCGPAWILRSWQPSARIPWAEIERLARPSRPQLRMIPGRARGISTTRRPLRELFAARGWILSEHTDGSADVKCPQSHLHSDGRQAARLYPPRTPGGLGWLNCFHQHCAGLTAWDVYRLLGG